MSEDSINPYAAPHTVNHPASDSSSVVPDRASEETLRKAIKLMLITETVYICSWLIVIFGLATDHLWEASFTDMMLLVAMLVFVTAWFLTLTLMFTIKSKKWWICLFILIPCLGIIAFLACINDTRRFLLRNGYRPGVFWSYPDEDEIAAMAEDPNYVPDASVNRDGTIRSLPYPLTLTAGAVILLAIITLTVIAAVVLA